MLPNDLQTETLLLYTVLTTLRPTWAGALILAVNLTPATSALALAANIAGAACLILDPSHDHCRVALRTGAVDFVVNSLDEALRALKNEIRKGSPLTVVLEIDPVHTLAAILKRGLLPELFTATTFPGRPGPDYSATALALRTFGATLLDIDGTLHPIPHALAAAGRFAAHTVAADLTLYTFHLPTIAALRAFDTRAQTLTPVTDPRHRWTTASPRHFTRPSTPGSPRHRVLLLTPAERELLSHDDTALQNRSF